MIKKLLFPDIESSPALTGSANCSCFEPIWQNGDLIGPNEYDLSRLEFVCESLPAGKMTEFAVTDVGCPVVSEKFKTFFDSQAVHNIQYFPATIIEKPGTSPLRGYYACNIIGTINCIDFDKSKLDIEEEDGEVVDIYEVDTLVLNQSSFAYIYRLYFYERVIVLEEPVASAIQSANFSGAKIIEPERWDGFAGEK